MQYHRHSPCSLHDKRHLHQSYMAGGSNLVFVRWASLTFSTLSLWASIQQIIHKEPSTEEKDQQFYLYLEVVRVDLVLFKC